MTKPKAKEPVVGRRNTDIGVPCPECPAGKKKKGLTLHKSLFLSPDLGDGQRPFQRRYSVCDACWKRQYKKRYGIAFSKSSLGADGTGAENAIA